MALPTNNNDTSSTTPNSNLDINQIQGKLLTSQQNLDDILAQQMNKKPDIWQALAAFGKPTRTGSLAESASNFSEEYANQQKELENKIPSLAQMRSALGAQTLKTAQEMQGNQLMQQYNQTGFLDKINTSINNGEPPSSTDMATLSKLYALAPSGSSAKTEFGKMFEMADKLATQGRETVKLNSELASKGMDVAKFIIENGQQAFDMLPQATKDLLQKNSNKSNQQPVATTAQPTAQTTEQPVYPPPKPMTITSDFGNRINPIDGKTPQFHAGIDLAQPEGVGVVPMDAGKVVKVEKNQGGFGNRVVIDHGNGLQSYYAHMRDVDVKEGDKVDPNNPIGTVGRTGTVTGPHTEFGVLQNGKPIDPKPYIKDKNLFTQYKPVAPSAPSPAGTQVASTDRYAGFPIKQQQAFQAADVERINKKLDEVPDLMSSANKQIIIGNTLYNTVKGNEEAFGILRQNPTLAKSFANFLESGIKVGNFQAGFPIEESVRKSLPERQQFAIQKVESLLNQIAIQTAGQMKGSVSNYEDKMVKSVYGTPSNSAEFLKYIANRVKIEGQYQKDLAENFAKINASKPSMTYTQYIMSPQVKMMEKQFNDAVDFAAKTSAKRMGIKDLD